MTTRGVSTPEVTEAAKQWTEYLERFKLALDGLYDICQSTQNYAGCREVLLYLGNATHAFESLIVMIDVEQNWEKDPSSKHQAVAWEIKATSAANKSIQQEQEGIWQIVRGRGRKNTLSSDSSMEDSNRSEKENKKTNVYERLAYGIRRPVRPFSPEVTNPDSVPGNNLMYPRSAMDLPQTKSSMAKMAYSRAQLWTSQVKPLLEEKLSSIQRRQANLAMSNRRPTYSQIAKQPPKPKSECDPNRSREPSLASISETAEEDDNLSTITMAEKPHSPRSSSEKILAELGGDDEWLAMTAEEESLAQEEESLQKEILEEERSSIDDEFEREANKQFGKAGIRYRKSWKEVIENWTQLNEKISPDLCYRKPGEAAQMHEKLSSPSRRRTKTDFEKRSEERQQRALELRQRLLEEKANRLKDLHAKVEEIRQKRVEVEEKKRIMIEEKMEKAAEKREKNIAEVVKKAREDDLRCQEVQLIKTLENMSRKSEFQAREEGRKEKLRTLAIEQAKRAEKKAAKYAQVEENRAALLQKDAEKLLEHTEKSEARLQTAAANRNELLEGMRKKQKVLSEKIDRLKAMETQTSQTLVDRMQNKHEKAEKQYEEGLETVKLRAAELSSPRPQSFATLLSDCLQNPSEVEGVKKECSLCKTRIASMLHALAHICAAGHLKYRKIEGHELNFEVKQELDAYIVPSPDSEGEDDRTASAIPTPNESTAKKKRAKLKQRLLKDNLPLSLVSTAVIEKGIYRTLKDLEVHLQSANRAQSLSETTRTHIEKNLNIFDKQIGAIRNAADREINIARIVPSTTVTESVMKLLSLPVFCCASNKAVKRLYLKCCAFLTCIFSPFPSAEVIFNSHYLTDLTDLLILYIRASHDEGEYDLAIATLHIIYQLAFSLQKEFPTRSKQRLNVLTAYLISHGFNEFIKEVLAQISTGSIADKLELSSCCYVGVIETISGFIDLVLRNIPDGQDNQEIVHQLFQVFFNQSTNYLLNAIPRDPCPASSLPTDWTQNEEIVGRNFFGSLARAFIRCTPHPKAFAYLKLALTKDDSQNGLRIAFILNAVIQKRIQMIAHYEDLPALAVRVVAYFVSIDPIMQRFSLVGWQNSLLLTLCRQSFDLLSPQEARNAVLAAIFSIVRKSKAAIEAMETEMGVSWLAIFLEILGKLQKLRKALKKSPREEPQEDPRQPQAEPKVVPSAEALVSPETTECREESVYNFANLQQRLQKISEGGQQPPLQPKNTGKAPLGMPETQVIDRPPRPPKPPQAVLEEEGDESQGEDEGASVSSEEAEQLPPVIQRHIPLRLSTAPLPHRQLPAIREVPLPPHVIDPLQLLRVPPANALREKMAEIFAVEEIGTVPLAKLMEIRRHLQSLSNVDQFFEAIPLAHLSHISVNIIETILHLVDDVDEVNELILKHVKQYLNFLFLCGTRSSKFRLTFEKHSALHWLGMLRFDPIRADIIYSLNVFTSNISVLYTDENFIHFLCDIVSNYQSFAEASDQRTYICIFVARLLQDYPYFLYRSYTSLNRNIFNELLSIVEKIVRAKVEDEKKLPLLPSAIRFIIKIFDISIDDFREERVDWHAHVMRLTSCMDIMSFTIRNISAYHQYFENPSLMHNACAIQELLLCGDEIVRSGRGVRRVEVPANRVIGNRRPRHEDEDNSRMITSCEDIDKTIEGVVRSKTMPTEGPPDKKYARKTIEQNTIEEVPLSSSTQFPLPSVEILEADLTTPFRSRDSFLNLYKQRKISAFYILNLKRATMRLLGSLSVANRNNKDIAASHNVVDITFKLVRAGDSVKIDYVTLVKRALTEICTDHPKNLQALSDIEQHPSHLVSKKDVIDAIYSNTHNGTTH